MAGGSTSSRRGLHAYRLLRRNFSRRDSQLRDWRPVRPQWLAGDVRGWRPARGIARVGASRREGTFALEGKGQRCEFLANLAAVRGSVFEILATPYRSQHIVYARLY